MENFVEELNFMKRQNAILQILSIDELAPLLQQLLDDNDFRKQYETNTEKLSANVGRILDDYTALILSDHNQ
jgi:3-deoxy-D-manno-octulosonic-acid transferase